MPAGCSLPHVCIFFFFFCCAATDDGSLDLRESCCAEAGQMTASVALLRAVTLSRVDAPPRRLTGATLLAACASVDCHNARLYASSGNVVFTSCPSGDEAASGEEASRRLESALASALGAAVPVTVVPASRLVEALGSAPPPALASEQQHFYVPLFSGVSLLRTGRIGAPRCTGHGHAAARQRRCARALRGECALQSLQRGYRARARRPGHDTQPRHSRRSGSVVRRWAFGLRAREA